MRSLEVSEFYLVSGGSESFGTGYEGEPTGDLGCYSAKNNNGYGNGAEAGPPPGRSGEHNPQLLDWNLGPRGAR